MAKTRLLLAVVLAVLPVFLTAGIARADARTTFLIEKLRADDFRVRTSAALQLGATGDDAAVDPLCSALGDGNDVVRQAAGAGLARLAKPAATSCVQQHLQSEQNPSVKAQLEKTLASLQAVGGAGGGGGGGGCIVNGPGESKHADIGISLPGTGETPAAPVFIDGQKAMTLRGDNIVSEFKTLVETYIERRFGVGAQSAAE